MFGRHGWARICTLYGFNTVVVVGLFYVVLMNEAFHFDSMLWYLLTCRYSAASNWKAGPHAVSTIVLCLHKYILLLSSYSSCSLDYTDKQAC